MNERQRMQYLEAMGIDMYVPRLVLPGAKVSVQCILPVAESVLPAAANHVAHDQSSPVDVLSSRVDSSVATSRAPAPVEPARGVSAGNTETVTRTSAFIDQLISPDKPVRPKPASSVSAPLKESNQAQAARQALHALAGVSPEVPKKAVKFSLSLWWTSADILIVDSRDSQKALPTSALLSNMLFAVSGQRQLPKPDVLNWPVVENSPVPQGIDEAREMVSAFVQGRLASVRARSVWLMGDNAVKAFVPNTNAIERFDSVSLPASVSASPAIPSIHPLRAVLLPSLSDMLVTPSKKRGAWQRLQAFYQLS